MTELARQVDLKNICQRVQFSRFLNILQRQFTFAFIGTQKL
jgi:hypothetical protein